MSFAIEIDSTGLAFDAVDVAATSTSAVTLSTTGGPPEASVVSVTGDFSSADSGDHGKNAFAGAGLTVNLSFTPTGTGTRTGELEVTWPGGSAREALQATGLAPVAPTLDDDSPHDFGTIELGSPSSASFTLSNPALRPGSVVDESCTATATVTGAGYTVDPSTEQTVVVNGSSTFIVTFDPTAEQAYPATLSIAWQRATSSGTLDVDLTGTGQAPVVVPPAPTFVAALGQTEVTFADTYVANETAGSSVMLTANDDSTDVTIEVLGDFESSEEGTRQVPTGGVPIPLLFGPASPGPLTGTLRVTWAGGSDECALSGNGLAPTAPTRSPSSLDYQTLALGDSLGAPFSFVNPTDAANTLDELCDVTPEPDASFLECFTVAPTGTQTVPEGGTQVFTITFAPTVKGDYTRTLRLRWVRSGVSGFLDIQVTGKGEEHISVAGSETTTTGVTDSSGVLSQRQRAGWYVPTYESYVSLGAAWTPTGTSLPATQNGFTATTSRHIFMRAAGTVTFQSENGPVWLQSEQGPSYSVSGGNTSLIGKENVYVGGGGYVGFMAGYAGAPLAADASTTYGNDNPARPNAINKLPPAFLVADWVWSIADKLVGVSSAFYLVWHATKLGNHKKALGKIACVASTTSQVLGLTSFIVGRAMGSPKKEANFYSQAGILMGTPAFASIYGTLGVNYRSANITLLGNLGVAVDSVGATSLDSPAGDTAISAKDANVSCWSGVYTYATFGKLGVLGMKIAMGGFLVDGIQLPTDTIEMSSTGEVDVSTFLPTSKVALKARTVAVWPDPVAKLAVESSTIALFDSPKTTIRLNSAEGVVAWTIEASAAGVEIKDTTGEALLSLKPGSIKIGPASGLTEVSSAATKVAAGAMTISPASILLGGLGELL